MISFARIGRRPAALRVCLVLLVLAPRADAQSAPDTVALRDAVSHAQVALSSLRSLWGIDGSDVRWIFTDGRNHVSTARVADGVRLEAVTLPAGTVIANHAIDWNGRRFAMVMLPLPSNAQLRTALLVHEAMHTFQPEQLPRAANTEQARVVKSWRATRRARGCSSSCERSRRR